MSVDFFIIDGSGNPIRAKVDKSKALCIIENPFPPFGVEGGMRVFRQFLTTDGTSTGSSDMTVNGSSTNVDFYVQADVDKDRYISMLSFFLADASIEPNKFGGLSSLTNGCHLKYSDIKGTVDIHDSLKTNFDIMRLCGKGNPGIGDAVTTFLIEKVNAGGESGYLPVLDLVEMFRFRWGLKLSAGSKQRITLTVKDNLSSISDFDIIAYGFEREE